MSYKSIAIDGPSGAGKSTLAKMLAESLGYLYVDTGAIYRTLGLFAIENGIAADDAAGVIDLLTTINIELCHGTDGLQHMVLNGRDVTADIRQHRVSAYASAVSAIPEVRAFLLQMQRDLAATQNIVMDGRDIGTVVLPNADVKIFLTAEPADRAKRRHEELLSRGQDARYEQILADVIQRDHNDMSRASAPLKQAQDALLVDTTGNSLERSYQVLLQTVKEKLGL